ncbi:kinase-like domain-containing protein [Rhizophagus irregularis DAOM 181602=DAOM 197198]|nr:kinase-like domain-containing protein [Rhizophagus irregularis DAOM 181602=DAOM 197198]
MSTEQEELTIFQQGEILGAWKCGTSIQKISETLQYSQSTIKDVISSYENVKNDELEKPCEKCELVITKYKWSMWSDGPLRYNFENMKGTRKSNEMVTLKYFHNSKNMINEFLNKVILYVMMNENNKNELHLKIYGISQDPNTNEYIMIMQEYQDEKYGKRYENMEDEWCILCQMYDIKINSTSWTSGDEEIDELISEFTQEIQLKIIKSCDTIFEWIPYNRFINIKEVGKGHFMTIYSAIWKDGPLHYDLKSVKGTRKSNKNVTLKCYYNSHDKINKILEKVKTYPINRINGTLGISQNPYTKDYVIVFQGDYCERCDEEYSEKNDDKVLSYSATWKDGPLSYYDSKDKNIIRDSNEKVTLKYLSDTQNIINEFLSKV